MEGAVPLPGLSLDYVDPNKEYVLMNKEGKTIKSGGDNGYVSQAIGEGIPLQVNQAGEWSTPYTYKPEKVDVGYDEKNNTLKVSASNAFMNSSFGATFQKDLQTKLDTVKTLDDLNTALTQINTDWGENGGQIELYNGATVEARKISPDFGIDQLKIYNETATAPFDDTTGKINPDAEVYEIRPFDMKLDVDENGMAKKVPYKQLLGRIASLRDTEQEKYLKSLSELSRNRQVDPNYRAAAMAISRAWERDKGVADQFKTEITNAGGKGFLGLGLSGTNELSNRLAEESNAAAQAAGDLLDANNIASEEGEYYDVINKVPDSPEKRKVVWKYENARRRYEEEYWYQKQWNEEVREQNQRVYDIAETGVDLVSAAFPQFGAAMLAEQAIVYAIGAGLEHQWGVENSITTDMQDQFTRRYAGMTANEMEKVFASGDAGKIIATVANLGMNIGFDAVDIATVFKNASISQKVAGKSVKQYVTEGLFAQNLLDTMAPPTNQFVSALSKAVGKRIVGGAVVGGVLGGTTTALNIATGLVESDNAAGDIAMGALGGAARGALVSGVGNALQLGTRYNGAEPMAVTSGGRAIQAPILHQDGTTTGRNLTQAEFDAMDVQSRSRVREWSSPLDMDIIRSQIEIRGGFRVLNPDSDIPTPEGYSARPITLADVGSGRSVDLFTKNSESTTIPTTKVESTPFAVDPVLNDDGTAIVMKSTESVDWHRVPEASSTESPVVKHYKEISEPHQAIRKMRIKAPVSPGAVEGFSKQTYIEYPKTASGDVLKAVMIKPASRVNYAMATRLLENMGFDKAGVAELNKIQTDAFARGETDMTIYATALSEVMPARAIDTVDLSSGRYEVNAESQELARISEALTGYATLLKNEGFDPEVDSLASIETKLNNLGNRYEAIIELMRPVMPSLDSQKPIAEVAPSARSGVVDEVRSRIEQAKSLDDGAQVRALYDTMLDDLELQARGAGFESKREGTPTNSRGISGALYEMDNIEKGRTVRAAFSTEQQSVFDTVYAMQRVAYEYQLESRSMGLISSKLKLSDIGDTGKYHIPHASNNSLASRIGANVANRMKTIDKAVGLKNY